jgi:hypothetical protein
VGAREFPQCHALLGMNARYVLLRLPGYLEAWTRHRKVLIMPPPLS